MILEHRSHQQWLKSGDCNTRHFHWKASAWKDKNEITGLFNDNGVWCKGKSELKRIVVNYFSGLFCFGQLSVVKWQSVVDNVPLKLSNRWSEFLNLPFSAADVHKTVFDIAPTKAPRCDGMQALFYQNFWDTIGGDVTAACLRCLL